MMQDSELHNDYNQKNNETLFEIDFDFEKKVEMDEEEKKRIYQELMSLDW